MNDNWLYRTEMLTGKENLKKLKETSITIAGVGGVGSWVAENAARCGIGNISLIDPDTINYSNINRQIQALHSTTGKYKTDVLKTRLLDINPKAEIHEYRDFLSEDNISQIISKSNFVFDCIDTLTPKENLIVFCLENKVNLISALGSGGKTDPEKIKISDISKSYNCALGRMLRKRLHKRGIRKGFKVVFSSELPDKTKMELENSRNKISNYGTFSYIPSVMGAYMLGVAVQELLNLANSR